MASTLVVGGCEEEPVPFVIDEEEIGRYLRESDDGRDLFRAGQFISSDPFTIPYDAAVYVYLLDSSWRRTEISVLSEERTRQIEGLPFLARDAEVIVDDFFAVSILRIVGSDTTSQSDTWALTRYGYFVKMGDDGEAFKGWKLFGFSAGRAQTPAGLRIFRADGTYFRGDGRDYQPFRWIEYDLDGNRVRAGQTSEAYLRVQDIGAVSDGAKLRLRGESVPKASFYQHVTAATTNGYVQDMMDRVVNGTDSSVYEYILSTPQNNPRLYSLILFQEVRRFFIPNQPVDSMGINRYFWCAPYR